MEVFTFAAYEASKAMLQICGFIILFCSFSNVINNSALPEFIKNIILATSEITSAITIYHSPIILAFLLGFGGFCVHFQVLSAGKEVRPSYLRFVLSRILHGTISAIVCAALLKCFPISIQTAKIEISYAKENNILAFCSFIFTLVDFGFSVKNYKKV